MKYEQIKFQPLTGIQLAAAKIRLSEGEAQISQNFDYERPPGARVRAGYARLLTSDGLPIAQVAGRISRIIAFERDDNIVKLVIAQGEFVQEIQPGDTEWT